MIRPVTLMVLATLGTLLGVTLALTAPEPETSQSIEWLEHPRRLGSFSLEGDGRQFENESLEGRWTIVLFGFLHCPDICPTSLALMAKLANDLSHAQIDKVAYVFVSIDPGRDSSVDVARYVRHFDPSFRGVTGDVNQLKLFAADLGVQFKVTADAEDYSVAHSITFSIIDSEGMLRGRFRPGADVTDLVASLSQKLKEVRT